MRSSFDDHSGVSVVVLRIRHRPYWKYMRKGSRANLRGTEASKIANASSFPVQPLSHGSSPHQMRRSFEVPPHVVSRSPGSKDGLQLERSRSLWYHFRASLDTSKPQGTRGTSSHTWLQARALLSSSLLHVLATPPVRASCSHGHISSHWSTTGLISSSPHSILTHSDQSCVCTRVCQWIEDSLPITK